VIKFYEDFVIGEENVLGSHEFTKEQIVAFASAYDPQLFHLDEAAGAASIFGSLCASGWHTACVGMRVLVDWRDARRREAEARGVTVPALGVSPGVTDLRWANPVRPGDIVTYSIRVESMRETKRPAWGLVGHHTRGVDQRDREVISFHSLVFVARRGAPRPSAS
jgi:acyl dehydratase